MMRAEAVQKRAITFLKESGATDVGIETGGPHKRLVYTLNNVRKFHVLSSHPHDNDLNVLLQDLARDVKQLMPAPDNRVVKVSLVRSGGQAGGVACRIGFSRDAYKALNPRGFENIGIEFLKESVPAPTPHMEYRIVLRPMSQNGYKPEYRDEAGKRPTSLAWAIQTKQMPDWLARKVVRAEVARCIWPRMGTELIVTIPDSMIRREQPSTSLNGSIPNQKSSPEETKAGLLSDGRAALQLLNEWLATQQADGKLVTVSSEEIEGKIAVKIILGEEL